MWQQGYQKKASQPVLHSDPVPGGGIPGPCPPDWVLVPPKRGLCPEEINRVGASGAQIEVQISVFGGLTPDFVTFLGITCFRPEKTLEFAISAKKSLRLFAPPLVPFIQTGMNFSCPPKIYFCPPSHAILAPGLITLALHFICGVYA